MKNKAYKKMIYDIFLTPLDPNAPIFHYLKRSFYWHLSLLLCFFLVSWLLNINWFFWRTSPLVVTGVRVDLVDMPKQTLKELKHFVPMETKASDFKDLGTVVKEEVRDDELSLLKEKNDFDRLAKELSEKKLKSLKEQNKKSLGRELDKLREEIQYAGNKIVKGVSATGAVNEMDVDENLARYAGLITQSLKSHFDLPAYLKDRKDLKAFVLIKIDSKGNAKDVRFTAQSGDALFDQRVLEAIERASPFQSPPLDVVTEISQKGITVAFPFL